MSGHGDHPTSSDSRCTARTFPGLLEHWADHKPDHPALVWDPARGREPAWTYAELLTDVRRLAAGLRAAASSWATRCSSTPRTRPRWCSPGWRARRSARSAVTTNTKSVGAEIDLLRRAHRCVAAITQPQYAAMVAAAAPRAEVDGRHRRQQRRTAGRRAKRTTASTVRHTLRRRRRLDATRIDPMLPFGIMFTSGTTSRPKAVVHTHANAIWASRTGPRNIDLTTDDTLPDLPPVLPRERAELVAVGRPRRRRDRGAHAEVVDEPVLGRRRRTRSPTSR